jgi:hypothetical protein
MFVITIVYTYNNDTSMFLFTLLLITVFFYIYELVEYRIEAITEPIHRIEKICANKKIYTNFTDLTNKTSGPSANTNIPNEFSELLNDIKYSRY